MNSADKHIWIWQKCGEDKTYYICHNRIFFTREDARKFLRDKETHGYKFKITKYVLSEE